MTDEEVTKLINEQDKLPIWRYRKGKMDFFGVAAKMETAVTKSAPIRIELPQNINVYNAVLDGREIPMCDNGGTEYHMTCRHALLLAEMLTTAVRSVQDAGAKGDV